MATMTQLVQTLEQVHEQHHILPLQNGMALLLCTRGGRSLGLFEAPDSANLYWTNPVLESPEEFRQFAKDGGWNLGGERCWIGPEIQFNIRDRADFFGTLSVPTTMDPGQYRLTATADWVAFQQQIILQAHVLGEGETELNIEHIIQPAANPLRNLSQHDELMDSVCYGGYEQTTTLKQVTASPIRSEIWNLLQLNAGGQLFIPCTEPLEASSYFGSVPEEARSVHENHIRLHITGKRQYKVGYKAPCMTGRMGYWNNLASGREYLLVRHFFNNPSAFYTEEPPGQPGCSGHSVHVYNDGGQFGGDSSFGEMECSGQAIGADTGRSSSTDSFILWAFVGAAEPIRRIARILLGVTL